MFKSLSSSSRKLHSQLESLVFSRELLAQPDVTFNVTPYPNGDLIGYDGEIACLSFDSVQSLLAVATKSGRITLYGDFERLPRLSWNLKPALAVNHLLFKSGTSYLLVVGERSVLHLGHYSSRRKRPEALTYTRCQRDSPCIRHCRPRRPWRTQETAFAFYAIKSKVSVVNQDYHIPSGIC